MIVSELVQEWRSRANSLEPYAPFVAQAFRKAADELERTLSDAEDSVSLKEAAAIGGYSVDALQRMVAKGRLTNVGRKGKPRIQRAQVPIKPGHSAGLLDGPAGVSIRPTAVVASAIARGH